ncbi:MAG: aldehyde dehydrogenase family protein [Thermodesulfobacteriota bacterium]
MKSILDRLGFSGPLSGAGAGTWLDCRGKSVASVSPIHGKTVGEIRCAGKKEYERVIRQAVSGFMEWRRIPAPKRGEVVRQIAQALREHKRELGALVSLEVGKILTEGEGEVQEMIDIADFAVGQSRMLYGLSMHSERPDHRMYEQWHPLGPVGVITAFNFPVAVWAWNAMLAMIAGDTVIWKPSSKAPLCAIAVSEIAWRVLRANRLPEGILCLLIGDRQHIGEPLVADTRIPLISATGSVRMGKAVAATVAGRLGRTLLELGGNNAVIVTPQADLGMAVRAIVFGAVGTAGQRCTSTRRVIAHRAIYEELKEALLSAYRQVTIGNPLEEGVLMGPLIDRQAVDNMRKALGTIEGQGGRVLYGGEVLKGGKYRAGTYVTPCICEVPRELPIIREEIFAPILYLISCDSLEEAIAIQNDVPQGLSSAIFTRHLQEAEKFLCCAGSDCGIANVNIGTSGAEIGGAFGGEKETGGGREAGSDAWRAYMRRQTNTINWSADLPLAQGIRFEL